MAGIANHRDDALDNVLTAVRQIADAKPHLESLVLQKRHLRIDTATENKLDETLVVVLSCAENIRHHVQGYRGI